jgi:hypothetical protein
MSEMKSKSFVLIVAGVLLLCLCSAPVTALTPTIFNVNPSDGPSTMPAALVTIQGENFTAPLLGVSFSNSFHENIPVNSINLINPQFIQCTLDLRGMRAGSYMVSVTNAGGENGYLYDAFTVDPPVVTAASTSIDGATIILTFDKPMTDPAGKEGEFKYYINGGGVPQSFSSVAVFGGQFFRLTTSGTAIAPGDSVTVTFLKGTVTSTDGAYLSTVLYKPVTNNMPSSGTPVTACQVINSPGTYILQNDILDSTATRCIDIRIPVHQRVKRVSISIIGPLYSQISPLKTLQ